MQNKKKTAFALQWILVMLYWHQPLKKTDQLTKIEAG